MKKLLFISTIVFLAILALSTMRVEAINFITSRASLGGNDYIDWGVLGPPYPTTPIINSPFSIGSNSGLVNAEVSNPMGNFTRNDQAPIGRWEGNFANGDKLLETYSPPIPINIPDIINISFGTPVLGVGAQIQHNFYGNFTGKIDAFDTLNNLLGSFTLEGVSDNKADNSAIFLGALVDVGDPYIGKISYSAYSPIYLSDIAINRLDLLVPVPEPATMLLLGSGLVGLAGYGRKKFFKK